MPQGMIIRPLNNQRKNPHPKKFNIYELDKDKYTFSKGGALINKFRKVRVNTNKTERI